MHKRCRCHRYTKRLLLGNDRKQRSARTPGNVDLDPVFPIPADRPAGGPGWLEIMQDRDSEYINCRISWIETSFCLSCRLLCIRAAHWRVAIYLLELDRLFHQCHFMLNSNHDEPTGFLVCHKVLIASVAYSGKGTGQAQPLVAPNLLNMPQILRLNDL